MCRRDFTDEEAEKIFKTLHERFPDEWGRRHQLGTSNLRHRRLLRTHHLQGATPRHHRKQVRL